MTTADAPGRIPPRAPIVLDTPQLGVALADATAVDQALGQLWNEVLGKPAGPDEDFFAAGGTPAQARALLARVHTELGIHVTERTFAASPTRRTLGCWQSFAYRPADFRRTVIQNARGTQPPLIAVHNIGGHYGLALALGADQPLISLQVLDPDAMPASLPTTLRALAEAYADLLDEVYPRGPFTLMGWCVAGPLAFELAHCLHGRGRTPLRVFLLESWLPQYWQQLPRWRRWIGRTTIRWQQMRWDWKRLREAGHGWGAYLRNRRQIQRLFRWAGISPPIDPAARIVTPELVAHELKAFEYVQALNRRFEPRPYAGAVCLTRSREEPAGWLFDRHQGWGPWVRSDIEVIDLPEDHHRTFIEPAVGVLARAMRPLLLERRLMHRRRRTIPHAQERRRIDRRCYQ